MWQADTAKQWMGRSARPLPTLCPCAPSPQFKTATRSRTLSPTWNESFTLLVHSTEQQELQLALWDSGGWVGGALSVGVTSAAVVGGLVCDATAAGWPCLAARPPHPGNPACPAPDLWRPDDLIGRVSLPLRTLDLAAGALNDLWLQVPRDGGKRGYSKTAEEEQQLQRVQVARVPPGGDAGLDGSVSVAAREDTAARLDVASAGSSSPSLGSRPPSPAGKDASRASPQALNRASGGLQQLRNMAFSPLDALLRSKRCLLHVQTSYLPLTADEIAAMARAAGRQQAGGGGGVVAPQLVSRTSTLGSPRVTNLLRRRAGCWAGGRVVHAICAHVDGQAQLPLHSPTALQRRAGGLHRPRPGPEQLCSAGLYSHVRWLQHWAAVHLPSCQEVCAAGAALIPCPFGTALQARQGAGGRPQEEHGAGKGKQTLTAPGRPHPPCQLQLETHCTPATSPTSCQVPFRHRANPMFDETLELIVDGETASWRDLQVHIELWSDRWVRRPAFKVCVCVRAGVRKGASLEACSPPAALSCCCCKSAATLQMQLSTRPHLPAGPSQPAAGAGDGSAAAAGHVAAAGRRRAGHTDNGAVVDGGAGHVTRSLTAVCLRAASRCVCSALIHMFCQ